MARYSTDADWIVPHFEKMLYDNAQLIRLCNWAYAETGQELFRIRIEETIDWLQREMVVAGGGFASSLDADSEGEEGLFYTWTETELYETLRRESRHSCELLHFGSTTSLGGQADPDPKPGTGQRVYGQ